MPRAHKSTRESECAEHHPPLGFISELYILHDVLAHSCCAPLDFLFVFFSFPSDRPGGDGATALPRQNKPPFASHCSHLVSWPCCSSPCSYRANRRQHSYRRRTPIHHHETSMIGRLGCNHESFWSAADCASLARDCDRSTKARILGMGAVLETKERLRVESGLNRVSGMAP